MLNKVQIIGHLGADPEVRTFQNGSKVANLRVATSERWKDKNTGEQREATEWHSVAIFAEHGVRYAELYLRKGAKVYIEGKLQTRKWQDQSGQDRYTTEITIRPFNGTVQGLDKREGGDNGGQGQGGGYGGGSGGDQGGGSSGSGGYSGAHGGEGSGYGGGSSNDLDDEIPF